MSSITLDDFSYGRAKALVARELPSKEQESRFKWTKTLTLAGFGLTVLWVGVLFADQPAQIAFLSLAAVSFLAAEVCFLSNISYLRRLWRSWKTARRLGFSRLRALPSRRPALDVLVEAALLTLLGIGLVIVFVSAIGVSTEISAGRLEWAGFGVVALVFGVMCILLYPMAWVRRRVHAVGAIHAELASAAAGPTDTPIAIHTAVYDDLVEIERTQIETDRVRIVAASERADTTNSGLHISADFFQSLVRLDPEQAGLVRQALDALSTDKRHQPAAVESAPVENMQVPATNLSIEIRRPSGRRVDVLRLRSAEDAKRGQDV